MAQSIKRGNRLYTVLSLVLFTAIGMLILIPLLAAFLASFRPGRELIRYGLNLKFDFANMSLINYGELFDGKNNYFLWFGNSMRLTFITVVLTLAVCYSVAYGLTMYHFKLEKFLFFLIIATMMVPFEILMLPMYQEIISLHLINKDLGVILPGLCGASTIFFFRQYLLGLPKELLDAGRMDGANEYRICFTIMMPLAKPAFAAMAILCAMGAWNNMLWPMLVYRNAAKFTLPIGLNTLLTPYGNNYDLLIAGSCFSILPVFVVFLIFQKYFISGMTAGAVKG
jgi:arabinosaccharide transport system permease protein